MSLVRKFKTYINNKEISIPYLTIIIGLALLPLFYYSWIESIIACFLKMSRFI